MKYNVSKVVFALPATLEPNTLYAVRVGTGFDLYVSDMTGTIAHTLNLPSQQAPSLLSNGGRFTLNNKRWTTDSDDVYALNKEQFTENCGNGNTPTVEWEHLGIFLPAGRVVQRLSLVGRVNGSGVADIELYGAAKRPTPPSRWNSGFDSDNETTHDLILNELWMQGQTGDIRDMHRKTWTINYVTTEDVLLSIYLRATSNNNTRYFYGTYTWEVS